MTRLRALLRLRSYRRAVEIRWCADFLTDLTEWKTS